MEKNSVAANKATYSAETSGAPSTAVVDEGQRKAIGNARIQQSALSLEDGCKLTVSRKEVSVLGINQKQVGEQALIEGGAKPAEILRSTKEQSKVNFLYDKHAEIADCSLRSQKKNWFVQPAMHT